MGMSLLPLTRWCITFADLKFFESEVQQAIDEGSFPEVHQPEGPSIYSVNEHYIKPVTESAGKMSWALMMNPDGLDCDLFVTHAWQEDVFEFTEKVLTSWPHRARHAWCCMLANPQNLDIAALLQSPSVSPFAIALQNASYMLVVPNRHESVYTRLWCGYEAYLAFQSNKIIRTATPSIGRQVVFAWLWMCPALAIGHAVGIVSKVKGLEVALKLIGVMKIFALLASLVSQNCGQIKLCLIANHVGLASGVATVIGCILPLSFSPLFAEQEGRVIASFGYILLVGYFLLAEVDRVYWQAEEHETELLQHQYRGSIRQASCSESQDEINIRNEIGEHFDEVDKVIQVLMKAGMTSNALREASLQGVELRHAGVVQLAIPILELGPGWLLGCWNLGRYFFLPFDDPIPQTRGLMASLQMASVLARLMFVILLLHRSIDERCFMLNVMAKMVAPIYFCYATFSLDFHRAVYLTVFCFYHLAFVLVLFFALLGIRGTLRLPCGTVLAEVFLSRILRCGCGGDSSDGVSSSEGGEAPSEASESGSGS